MGLLMKGNRIIVPSTLRKDIMKQIHQGHLGIENCKQRARCSVFWPGIDNEIEHLVSNCSTCLDHRNRQRRETLIPHEVPSAPWVKVATDLFELNNRHYVIVVDYRSKYFEVSRLYSTTSQSVIKALKKIFVSHGIPKIVFSDNGPQYTSRDFKKFSDEWDFQHESSSPEYPQSNGLVERKIQTVKRCLRKSEQNNEDPYIALLTLNSTPLKGAESPAEIMYGRKVRTLLPSITIKTDQSIPESTPNRNEGAVELKPLTPSTSVRIYSKRNKNWSKKGQVVKKQVQPRSYEVINEKGNVIRRNRRHLIPTQESFDVDLNYDDLVIDDNSNDQLPPAETHEESIETSNSQSEHTEPYKNRLRQNRSAPDRYGY